MENITTLIGSLGFPIVACVFLWKFISTTLQEFTKAMNNNTKMLEKVSDSIDRISLDQKNEVDYSKPERREDDGKIIS